jgi:hypothetical protein
MLRRLVAHPLAFAFWLLGSGVPFQVVDHFVPSGKLFPSAWARNLSVWSLTDRFGENHRAIVDGATGRQAAFLCRTDASKDKQYALIIM